MVDARTTLCCIIGDPVEHSLSPAMHNAAYAELGMNWVYTAHRVTDVGAAVAGIRALGIRGASVTIPHKVAVMEHLDQLDPVAEWIGSVNTIINDDGRLTGANTDGAGAMKALEDAGAGLSGKRVLMLGSGGGARAVAITLAAKAGIGSMEILGVIEEELTRLGKDVASKTGVDTKYGMMDDTSLKRAVEAAEVVIHCTPIGMHPKEGETVVPKELWRPGLMVMDIVYNPHDTRLLTEARAAGANIVHGLDMLLNQGVLQFQAWAGTDAPVAVMKEALEKWLEGQRAK